jgi:hypothetical protein
VGSRMKNSTSKKSVLGWKYVFLLIYPCFIHCLGWWFVFLSQNSVSDSPGVGSSLDVGGNRSYWSDDCLLRLFGWILSRFKKNGSASMLSDLEFFTARRIVFKISFFFSFSLFFLFFFRFFFLFLFLYFYFFLSPKFVFICRCLLLECQKVSEQVCRKKSAPPNSEFTVSSTDECSRLRRLHALFRENDLSQSNRQSTCAGDVAGAEFATTLC